MLAVLLGLLVAVLLLARPLVVALGGLGTEMPCGPSLSLFDEHPYAAACRVAALRHVFIAVAAGLGVAALTLASAIWAARRRATREPASVPLLVLAARSERSLAAACYLLPTLWLAVAAVVASEVVAGITWVVVLISPLVVWRQAKGRSPALRTHAARAFSVQVTANVAGVASALLLLPVAGLLTPLTMLWTGAPDSPFWWAFAVATVPAVLLQVYYLALGVAGAVGAWRNRFVRLPLVLPVLR